MLDRSNGMPTPPCSPTSGAGGPRVVRCPTPPVDRTTTVTTMFELCRRSDLGIYAVPYRDGRRQKAQRLPDGAIVESPLPDQRYDVPDPLEGAFEVAAGNVPATIHHANLGL